MKPLFTAFLFLVLTACTSQEVSWDTQETQRALAIENSEYNAQEFRMKNPQYADYTIRGRGDSSINKKCASGDGWASVDLIKGNRKVELKCSTSSVNIGCMVKKDFLTRSYAKEENRCNLDIPVPMPRIVK